MTIVMTKEVFQQALLLIYFGVLGEAGLLLYLLVVLSSLLIIPSKMSLPGKMSELRRTQLDLIRGVIINII